MPRSSGCRPICLFQLIRSINCVQFWIAVWKTLRNIFLTINKPTACDKAVGFLLLSLLCVVGGGVLDAPPICAPPVRAVGDAGPYGMFRLRVVGADIIRPRSCAGHRAGVYRRGGACPSRRICVNLSGRGKPLPYAMFRLRVVGGGVLDAPPICAPRFGPSGTPAPTHDRLHRLLAPPSGGSWRPEGLTEGLTPSFSPASPPHRWAPAPPPARPPRSTAGRSGGPRRTPPAGAAAGAPQAAAPAR